MVTSVGPEKLSPSLLMSQCIFLRLGGGYGKGSWAESGGEAV